MSKLTPIQSMKRILMNDARNIKTAREFLFTKGYIAQLVADCTVRLYDVRNMPTHNSSDELLRYAEDNLSDAADLWRPYAR